MSVESVARDFIATMNDPEKTMHALTPDAVVGGGVIPQPIPAMQAFAIVGGLAEAMPDIKFNVQQVTVNGNVATVRATWGGTQSRELKLPIPGMPTVPATGKKVSVNDIYIVTVQGDKVSKMMVDSPAGGGIPGALAQLGVKTPAM
jgi:predicted ester cyclase